MCTISNQLVYNDANNEEDTNICRPYNTIPLDSYSMDILLNDCKKYKTQSLKTLQIAFYLVTPGIISQ